MVTQKRKIRRIRFRPNTSAHEVYDELALDEPLCIFVNGEYHVTLISTPEKRKELAIGYLHSEGAISSIKDIKSIKTRNEDILVELNHNIDLREVSLGMMNLIVTACGTGQKMRVSQDDIPKVVSKIEVKANRILWMLEELNRRSNVHMKTRGTHAAMICTVDGDVLSFAEDVGRHNAIDKVIGSLVLKRKEMHQYILLSTGRQSAEMVQKVARGGIPIVASMTVPLISGVRLAELTGVTLSSIGKGMLKIYTNPYRIKIE
jgi:FdhD protein